MDYQEAIGLLSDLLIDVRDLRGTGADAYLPVTYGCLGECYFQKGEAARSVAPLEKAAELCERTGDVEGVATYLRNLYEVHRYLGHGEAAATSADRLAEVRGGQRRPEEAREFRTRARIARAGETLNRALGAVKAAIPSQKAATVPR